MKSNKKMKTVPVRDDVKERFPDIAAKWATFHKRFRVLPSLCAQTCAFLSTGKGKALAGKYFDCEQDVETVLAAGQDGLSGLYELKVDFLGGLLNDGGTALSIEESQE